MEKEQLEQALSQDVKPYQKVLQQYGAERSKEAEKTGDAMQNAAGIVNQGWYYDEQNEAFQFPYTFAETAEQMGRNPILGKALYARTSKLEMSSWKFGYQDEDLESSPQHRFVLDYLNEQIENCGGMNRFIKKNVLPALKYGVSVFAPVFDLETRYFKGEQLPLTRFKNIFWYHPAFMFRVFMDAEDLSRVGSIQYWLPNKATVSFDMDKNASQKMRDKISGDLSKYEKSKIRDNKTVERSLDMGGRLTLTDIDLKMRMGGVISYNTEGSNPIGRPYLYTQYGLHLFIESIINSSVRLMYSGGLHSYQAVPINPDSAFLNDNAGVTEQMMQAYEEFIKVKGGLFVSNTHKIEPISANEMKDLPQLLDTAFQFVMRTVGESVDTLGLDGGGSRSLSTAMLKAQQPELGLDANQLCYDINNTFLKYFTDMNFGHWMRSGYLKQYPIMKWDIGEVEEVLENAETRNINENKNEVLASAYYNKNSEGQTTESVISDGILQKKRYVKREPSGAVETITIDVAALEKAYYAGETAITEAVNKILREQVIPILQRSSGDLKLIRSQIEKITKEIRKELETILTTNAGAFARLSLDEYLRSALAAGGPAEAGKIAERAVKNAAPELKEKAAVASAALANEIINDISQFFNRNIALSNDEIINLAIKAFSADNQYNYVNFARDLTMYGADKANAAVIARLADSGRQVAVVRTAILEGSCGHCAELDGIIYYRNERGDYWNPDGIPYRELPDTECAGMIHGKGTCRCKYIPVYSGLLRMYEGGTL